MPHLSDAVERIEERAPELAPLAEHGETGRGEPVKASAALPRFLDPSTGDECLFFELVEEGI